MDIQSKTEYSQQIFKKLKIQGQEMISTEFDDCTFIDCVFTECTFRHCRFATCTFQNCDLSLSHVPNSTFRDIVFEKSKIVGLNWTEATWGIKGGILNSIAFAECALNYSTFFGIGLRGLKVKKCVAKDVDFAETDLTGADFRETDLTDSRFMHTNLTKADFRKARNYAINPTQNTLKKTQFSLPEAMSLLYGLDIVLTDEE